MVADRNPAHVTIEEWRELEHTSEVKHEYIDGAIRAMASGSAALPRIATNITTPLDNLLGDSPCIAYNSDLVTRVAEPRRTDAYVVACYPGDTPYHRNPRNSAASALTLPSNV
jgi:Uma2 family endonuclease